MFGERNVKAGSFREPVDDLIVKIGKERLPPRMREEDRLQDRKPSGDWPPFLLNDALAEWSRKRR